MRPGRRSRCSKVQHRRPKRSSGNHKKRLWVNSWATQKKRGTQRSLGSKQFGPIPIYRDICVYIYVYIVLLTPAFVKSSILRFPNIPIGAIKPLRRNHVSVSLDRLRFPHVASSCHSRETPTSELAPRDFDPKGFSVRFHASTRRKVRFFLWFPGSRSRILEP